MAKIAAELDRALAERRALGTSGAVSPRAIARGNGWSVADVICTSGPGDRRFEEEHTWFSLAIVVAGTFQYESPYGRAVLTPGATMVGNAGERYTCGHEHRAGDRCLAFAYSPEYFERVVADAGARDMRLTVPRLPAIRETAPLVARACAGLVRAADVSWEEIAVELACRILELGEGAFHPPRVPLQAEARVTDAVRAIDRRPSAPWSLETLARGTGLSPFHFLRTFERVAGVTPHQYVRRARLREAAVRLATEPSRVLDLALASGFGDVSNFNRAFRTEFSASPRAIRNSWQER